MTVVPTTPSEKLAALLPAVVIESSNSKNGKGASKPAANIQDVKRKAISLLTTVYKTESEEQVAELESKIKDLLKMINPEEAQKQIGQLQKEQQEENHQEDNLIPRPATSAVKVTPPTTTIASTASTLPKPTTPRSINRISSSPPPPTTTTRRPSVPIRTTLSATTTMKKSDSPKPTLRSISSISSSAPPPLPPTRRPTPRTATTSTTTTMASNNNNDDDLSQHIGEIPKPMKQFFQRADIERDEVNKQASFLEHAMGHHNNNNRRGSWVRRRKSFDDHDHVPAMIDVCGISCSHKSSNSKGHPDDDLSSTCTERTTQSSGSWRDRIGRVVGIRRHRHHPELAHANSSNLSTSDGSSTTNNSTTDSTNESMTNNNNINSKMVVDPLATTTEEEENEEEDEEGGEDRGLKETTSNISTDTPTADEGGQPRRWGSRWSQRAPVAA